MQIIRVFAAALLSLVVLATAGLVMATAQGPTATPTSTATVTDTVVATPPTGGATTAPTAAVTPAATGAATAAPTPAATTSPTTAPAATSTPAPTAGVLTNADDPARAEAMDNQPHTLAANSAVWYKFDYSINHMTGERPQLILTLVNGNNSGIGFSVYAPENIVGWWNNPPTGRGTIQMVDCTTGEPSESGECQSPDLVWRGGFGADDTYWVRVYNTNSTPTQYVLTFVQAGQNPGQP